MAATNNPEAPTTTREPERPASASPLDQYAPPTASAGRRSGRATSSLIVGIISIPAAIIALAGIVLGVVAIVLGATARRNRLPGAGQATAGMICGIVGLLLGLANMLAALMTMS
jgi:hypothetical protein